MSFKKWWEKFRNDNGISHRNIALEEVAGLAWNAALESVKNEPEFKVKVGERHETPEEVKAMELYLKEKYRQEPEFKVGDRVKLKMSIPDSKLIGTVRSMHFVDIQWDGKEDKNPYYCVDLRKVSS